MCSTSLFVLQPQDRLCTRVLSDLQQGWAGFTRPAGRAVRYRPARGISCDGKSGLAVASPIPDVRERLQWADPGQPILALVPLDNHHCPLGRLKAKQLLSGPYSCPARSIPLLYLSGPLGNALWR